MGKISRLNSYKNLSWLMNVSQQHQLPIYTLEAAAKALQQDVFYGSKKNDAKEMPELAESRFDSNTAKAIRAFFELTCDAQALVLKPFNANDVVPLLNKILIIHQEAIPWKFKASENFISESLKRIDPYNKPIRLIVRMFVETLDVFSATGEILGEFVTNLEEFNDWDDPIPDNQEEELDGAQGFSETSLKDLFEH
jgi:hypothetical protein